MIERGVFSSAFLCDVFVISEREIVKTMLTSSS